MSAITRTPIAALLASKTPPTPQRPPSTLARYPALAQAAAPQHPVKVDTAGETFSGVLATVETLTRLSLNPRQALTLCLLIRRGSMKPSELVSELRMTSAGVTVVVDSLELLTLITVERSPSDDRRTVILRISEPGRQVIGSIVALAALGSATAPLLKHGHKANGQSRLEVAHQA
ncbi:MAG: MarR family transcriptional regulator [Verrucomicrobiota bacterium]